MIRRRNPADKIRRHMERLDECRERDDREGFVRELIAWDEELVASFRRSARVWNPLLAVFTFATLVWNVRYGVPILTAVLAPLMGWNLYNAGRLAERSKLHAGAAAFRLGEHQRWVSEELGG